MKYYTQNEYMHLLPPSTRRAYGGRKDQRNVLLSHFAYGKLFFLLLRRGSIVLRRAPPGRELRIAWFASPAWVSIPWCIGGVSWSRLTRSRPALINSPCVMSVGSS